MDFEDDAPALPRTPAGRAPTLDIGDVSAAAPAAPAPASPAALDIVPLPPPLAPSACVCCKYTVGPFFRARGRQNVAGWGRPERYIELPEAWLCVYCTRKFDEGVSVLRTHDGMEFRRA